MINPLLFYVLSLLSLLLSLGVVFSRRPVYNVLLFVSFTFSIFAHVLLLKCSTLACLYILIYAGAMLVLFLFVLMLTLYNERKIDLFGVAQAGHYSVYFTIGFILLIIGFCFALIVTSLQSRSVLHLSHSVSAVSALSLSVLLIKDYSLGLWSCAFLILTAVVSLSTLAKKETS